MNRTAIWAHRGASSEAPENTMAAFELAIRQKADGIELDVQLTADGVTVVTHDEECRRLTGLSGMVGELTLSELRSRNFAWHRPEAGLHQIPTLTEVLDLIRTSHLVLNIELKNSEVLYPGLEEKVLQQLIDHQMQDRVVISSFNHYSLLKVMEIGREKNLHINCGALYRCGMVEPWHYARRIGLSAIHPHAGNLRIPDLIGQSHSAGIFVHVWTIDDPGQQAQAMRLGVDSIITNKPAQARIILQQRNHEGGAS